MQQVTNVTFFITKLRDHPIGRGKFLPHYIVENRGIVSLDKNIRTGKPYNDNLCFFRAIALHNGCHSKNLERDTQHYYERYRLNVPEKKKFSGVKLEDLPALERLFEVNICVYSLEPTKTDGEDGADVSEDEKNSPTPETAAQLINRSLCNHSSTLYLNLYQSHFSYIKDLNIYAKSFRCTRCDKFWRHTGMLHRHEKNCEAKVHHKFPGGVYKNPPTIFQLLEEEGFIIPQQMKFFPYRATFDFECMFDTDPGLENTKKLSWDAKHIPLSVSVCSNVPDYSEPKCFVSEGDPKQLVTKMVDYLIEISKKSYSLAKEKFNAIFEAIDKKLEKVEDSLKIQVNSKEKENEEGEGEDIIDTDGEEEDIEVETEEDRTFINDEELTEQGPSFYRALDFVLPEQSKSDFDREQPTEPRKMKQSPLRKLKERLEDFLKELPVIGFNSGKYDLNAVKEFLFPVMVKKEQVQFTIKRNNNFMCLKTEHLRFLDVTNFLAPGFSYEKFLKAYECPQTKGFFPYEWVDSLDKLQHPALPPHEAFYSSLSNKNISFEEYKYCQQVWTDNNIQTFRDFLIWYNNLDVQPFCDALEKMSAFWKAKKIDMLRQGISIPGITLIYLFSTLEPGIFFSLFNEKNKDLYTLFKQNLVGGPSIIFHRYHEAGKTVIREHEMKSQGKTPKLCQKVVGYDANGLYLWAIMQEMPTGSFTRRRKENEFRAEQNVKMATQWLEWEAHSRNINIRHEMNDIEKRIGEKRLPVDGFHGPSQTVFQFHGCYWHGHQCFLNEGKEMNDTRKKPMVELRKETENISAYIKDQGYNLVEMYECQWLELKRTNLEVIHFIQSKFRRPFGNYVTLNEKQILSAIKRGILFGVVECDIRVPEALKQKFSEMPPIFKNTEISRDDIGPYMKAFAEKHNLMRRPRRSLIGSYFGEKILLATPLIKWYLEHGLKVTKIYQIIQYTPVPCFKPFGEAVSDARRAGDVDSNKAIIADTMKLVRKLKVIS